MGPFIIPTNRRAVPATTAATARCARAVYRQGLDDAILSPDKRLDPCMTALTVGHPRFRHSPRGTARLLPEVLNLRLPFKIKSYLDTPTWPLLHSEQCSGLRMLATPRAPSTTWVISMSTLVHRGVHTRQHKSEPHHYHEKSYGMPVRSHRSTESSYRS